LVMLAYLDFIIAVEQAIQQSLQISSVDVSPRKSLLDKICHCELRLVSHESSDLLGRGASAILRTGSKQGVKM